MKIKLDENLPFTLAIPLTSFGHDVHTAYRVMELFQTENVADWARCFVVATDRKIRLVNPPPKPSSVSPPEPSTNPPSPLGSAPTLNVHNFLQENTE